VVFCRNLEPQFAPLAAFLAASAKPYVYDLDDNLFEVPGELEEGRYHSDPARQQQLRSYLRGAALVRVHAPALADVVAGLNPNVQVVKDAVDVASLPPRPERRPGDPVRIVYVTSRLEDALSRQFLPELEELMRRFAPRVELSFWGYHPPGFRGRPGVRMIRYDPDYERFLRRLAGAGFDLGLAPLVDDSFHRCKTNNKYREYGACGIAGVYSDVPVYSGCVEHERTGWLVPNRPGAWLDSLSRLVEDDALRARIQARARDDVRVRHSPEAAEAQWAAQIDEVLRSPAPPAAMDQAGSAALVPDPPGPAERLRALFRKAQRFVGRAVRLGPGPALQGAYRYAYDRKILRDIQRRLSVR
jgi:hypothetical protein